MISPHSKIGRMKVLYIVSSELRSRRYLRWAIMSTLFPALLTMLSTWIFQDKFLVSVIPRCWCESTSWIGELPNYTGIGWTRPFHDETSIDSVFDGQKAAWPDEISPKCCVRLEQPLLHLSLVSNVAFFKNKLLKASALSWLEKLTFSPSSIGGMSLSEFLSRNDFTVCHYFLGVILLSGRSLWAKVL